MNDLRQAFLGILAALLSGAIILGGFALSLAEGGLSVALAPSATLPSLETASLDRLATLPGKPTGTATLALAQPLLPTTTPQPLPTDCPLPPGWNRIPIRAGDTLAQLANVYDLDPAVLAANNCLTTGSLPPPPASLSVPVQKRPTAIPAAARCGPPQGWVVYIVRPGDNLSRLAAATGVSVSQLQQANCMGRSILIRVGQKFYVPFAPAPPPTSLPPPATSPAPTATRQPPIRPTRTPVPTVAIPTATDQPPIRPTRTPVPTVAIPTATEPPPATDPPVIDPPVTYEPPPGEPLPPAPQPN